MKNFFGSRIPALILLGILLALTNPSEEKHREVFLNRVEENEGKAGRYIVQGLEGFSCFFGECFDYRNYILFSTMYESKNSNNRLSIGFLGMVF